MSKNMATDRFQGLCMVQEDGAGARYMHFYDRLPPTVQMRLRNSSVNICVACVTNLLDEGAMIAFINKIEAKFRCEEAQ